MELKEGTIVAMRHYSMINVFSSVVIKKEEQAVEVKLPKDCMTASFLQGDPIVSAHETDSGAIIKGGRIREFKKNEQHLIYIEDEFDEGSRMRSYERFPVSLYADYRVMEEMGNKKSYALVKDISDYGVMIYSKEPHFKGMRLIMDIYLTREILSLTAEIVRKVGYEGYYEYGLKIKHTGSTVFNQIKTLVRKEQDELIGKYSR